ncbi:MAG: ABC transporter substrate-binding protein [Alphaproteobacteria bacterium]|nr:ABC transporter substrate-binding protein [Alphaproteobacteria bacterium]
MTNRFKLSTLAVAAVLAAGAAPASAETIKIGVISTYSGPMATQGEEIDHGLSLYVKTHEKELPPGVKVELVKRDDTGPIPDIAKRLAQELVTRDKVRFLIGVVWTPNGYAICSIADEAKVPFISTNAAGVDMPRKTPYFARTSFTLWQDGQPMGKWAAQHGYKKAYVAVSDFAPGHEAGDAFTKGFTDGGGKVIGSVAFPLQNPDFVPFLQRVKDAKPDVLFIFVPAGPQATSAMKAYNDLGLKGAKIALVGTQDLVPDEQLPLIGDAPLGLITAGTYSITANRPANKAFLAAWKKAYGDSMIPDFMAVDSWDGMNLLYTVIKDTKGKFTADQAMAIIKRWKDPNSPRGPISIDPATRDIVENVYIRRVEKVNGKLANVEIDTIPNVKDPWKETHPAK